MNLVPYTFETYQSLLSRYLDALWPFQILALIVCGFLFFCLYMRPYLHQHILWILAIGWTVLGLVFYGHWLVELTWAAPWFAQASLLQALLLLIWFFWLSRQMPAKPPTFSPIRVAISTALIGAGICHPLISAQFVYGWSALPLIAMTPISVCLISLGTLALFSQKSMMVLALIPSGLILFIALEHFELDNPMDMAVGIAPLIWAVVQIRK